jgi:signal transduction histidine kinase
MTHSGLSAQTERELNYYRRECNLLGARLVRIQEEQGQAYREARRSRTVVKLVREAYRLGDLKMIGADIGGPMLEILVDHTLCDRAALLREDPIGSGRFTIAHAIGLKLTEVETVFHIPAPPAFCFSSVQEPLSPALQPIGAVLQMPYVLWANDRGSGQALIIGNRNESNVNRPFEAGDQELIESALSVYLDVMYRKQVEAELRRAKQAAESASQTRSELLDMLAQDLRPALQTLGTLAARICPADGSTPRRAAAASDADEIARTTAYMLSLLDDAVRSGERSLSDAELDVEWVHVEDLVRAVLRLVYVPSVRRSIELDTTLPRRRVAICVDRARMIQVLRFLISGAMRQTLEGGTVRVTTARRSDGALEILVRGGAGLELVEPLRASCERMGDTARAFGSGLSFTRQLIEAQGATLLVEAAMDGVAQARILVPAQMTRDDDVTVDALP